MLDHVNDPAPAPQEHRDTDWRRLMELVARGIWHYALGALDGLGLPGREKVAVILAVDH